MKEQGMGKYIIPTYGNARPKGIIRGERYRITVLTPSLLRLEYLEEGAFEDRATQVVINRRFEVPLFQTSYETVDGVEWLTVETEKLRLRYDQREFSKEGLCIWVKDLDGAVWHFGQELHDLKGTYRTLDRADGDEFVSGEQREQICLENGVISREGFSVIDDSCSMILTEDGWVEPRKACKDLYFFGYGHRYLEALNDFYHLCGRTPLLPRFALGNWWSRYYRYTEETYQALMMRFEQEQLPFSVAVIDMDWHLVDDVDEKYGGKTRGWTGYTWNRKFFPEPERFLKWLHDRNMKVTLNVHPADGIRAFEEIYPKMAAAMGINPESGQAVEFNPADPVFMEKYFDILCHDLEKQGVDFWWIDWQQGEQSKVPGMDPLWMLNHYHYLDSGWKGTRPMTFSRYAGVGSHRYPIGFSGDTVISWESLQYQPYFTSTASNIGYGWWSHDIGGHYRGIRDDEMMARWIQYGVFSPINRLHSSQNPFSGKEPWRYDEITRTVMNRYLRLRHAMIPYLYTMNRRASRDDLPLILPIYYLEPECEEAYQVPNEYYFGTELLVSPVTEPADKVSRTAEVKTWLPKGQWADMFSGMVYEGNRMIWLRRPVDDIPVLMKAGAIVPMRDMEVYDNSVENPEAMEIHLFPAADGHFTLWEDAGDTQEDVDENWVSTELIWKTGVFTIGAAKGNRLVIPDMRSWKLVIYPVEKPCALVDVSADGDPIAVETYYEEEASRLILKIPAVDVTKTITITFAEALRIADRRRQLSFEILQRAQMDYNPKVKIWNALNEKSTNVEAALAEIEMNEQIRSCLLEVNCKNR